MLWLKSTKCLTWPLPFSRMSEISDSYDCKYEDDSLLGYCTMYSCRSRPTFRRCLLPSSSGQWADDGDNKHLWNVSLLVQDYIVQSHRRLSSSHSHTCFYHSLHHSFSICWHILLAEHPPHLPHPNCTANNVMHDIDFCGFPRCLKATARIITKIHK
jgi:hypothetical protein